MKKLLVLLVVLGLVATADAAPWTDQVLSLDGINAAPASDTIAVGSTINIAIVSRVATNTALYLELDDTAADALETIGAYSHGDWVYTGGTDMGMTQYAAAGGWGKIYDPVATGFAGFWDLEAIGVPPTFAPQSGEWFSINYKATSVGDTYITLYDSECNELSQMVVHQIPEPITMTLLGLGAVIVARRRKSLRFPGCKAYN
jgi:hypothetical protein